MHLKSLYPRKLAKKTMIMETKKSAQATIENKRFSLALMGLSVAGALTLMSFEYRNFEIQHNIALTGISQPFEIPEALIEVEIEKPIEPEVKKPMPPVIIPTTTPISANPAQVTVDPNASVNEGPTIDDGQTGITSTGPTEDEEDPEIEPIIDIPQYQAEFPGGMKALYEYLGNAINYPTIALENGIEGKVHVQFIVEKDGSITDIKVAKGSHKSIDNEALRVVNGMPKWIPGKVGNKTVRVRFTLPVVFKLK
jgi:protein TonB